ncbi:aminotransferase class I/II-fold pyridoxal phosphate-dependent enzyme [Bradyrhizobium sp. ARR65]|uniref:pyridoxal phosphate-dependent aminotransferase n=1 Tax=Bradyrhizobium sp. ARR65 TaxID=1040989 RepID=UPI000463E91A|nr:aminotransferase class I/II-fold pyridoxal phosphate-dependent enzyme [Bradyrhizobium sp. ARR65]
MLAQRIGLLKSSCNAVLWATAEAVAASGTQIIDLTSGDIWSEPAPSVREGAIIAINRDLNRYSDTIVPMALRHALARKISAETAQPWSADEIAVTSGVEQALFNAAMALLNPGDEVLVPAPYWTAFPVHITLAGGEPVFIETRHNNYVPKLIDLAAALTSKTKAIVVSTPNNPTGAIYDRSTLSGIAQLAIDRDLWIIFDECFSAFAHAPHTHHPIVSVAPRARDRTLIVNSLSKALALAGWRIGYVAGPKEVIGAIDALQSSTSSHPNIMVQHALLHHLECGDATFELQLQRHVANARVLGLSILSTLTSIPQPSAQGGFHFYLDFSGWQQRANALCREFAADDVVNVLLMDAGVATVSGTLFGDPAGVRLSYGIDLELLEKALRRLVATLNTWN